MKLLLDRLKDNKKSTIGILKIDGIWDAFTLEDAYHKEKIYGETRIPEGEYEIILRTEGGMNSAYSKKYGDDHEGMLWLQNVEGFEWVYIHTGNKHEHTDGCILVGTTCDSNDNRQMVGGSVLKYKKTYAKILKAIKRGEEVTIQII